MNVGQFLYVVELRVSLGKVIVPLNVVKQITMD